MREHRRVILVLSACVLLGALCIGGYWGLRSLLDRAPQGPMFEPAPEFALKSYGAKEVTLQDSAGSVRIITAFASWSAYSAEELRMLDRLAREYPDIEVIAINRKEPKPVARDFLTQVLPEEHTLTLLDDPEDTWFGDIGGYHMPETLFVDGEGNIRHHQRGPMSEEVARERIEMLRSTMNEE